MTTGAPAGEASQDLQDDRATDDRATEDRATEDQAGRVPRAPVGAWRNRAPRAWPLLAALADARGRLLGGQVPGPAGQP